MRIELRTCSEKRREGGKGKVRKWLVGDFPGIAMAFSALKAKLAGVVLRPLLLATISRRHACMTSRPHI